MQIGLCLSNSSLLREESAHHLFALVLPSGEQPNWSRNCHRARFLPQEMAMRATKCLLAHVSPLRPNTITHSLLCGQLISRRNSPISRHTVAGDKCSSVEPVCGRPFNLLAFNSLAFNSFLALEKVARESCSRKLLEKELAKELGKREPNECKTRELSEWPFRLDGKERQTLLRCESVAETVWRPLPCVCSIFIQKGYLSCLFARPRAELWPVFAGQLGGTAHSLQFRVHSAQCTVQAARDSAVFAVQFLLASCKSRRSTKAALKCKLSHTNSTNFANTAELSRQRIEVARGRKKKMRSFAVCLCLSACLPVCLSLSDSSCVPPVDIIKHGRRLSDYVRYRAREIKQNPKRPAS